MEKVYYDPSHPASFSSVKALAKASNSSMAATKQWLQSQRPYSLHVMARKRGYPTRPYRTKGIDYQWQADLVEMIPYATSNAGNKYILTLIDIFSRYAWAVPMKNKTPREVIKALTKVFQQGRKPSMYLQTDQGKEFENKEVKAFLARHGGIKQFAVKSQFKAALVERFNRTLKGRMWRYFTHAGGARKWLTVLPKLLKAYNASIHRAIGMAPKDVNKDNEFELWQVQQKEGHVKRKRKQLLKIGDYVRVSKVKNIFAKGYEDEWTEEVFIIKDVIKKAPSPVVMYKLQDYEGIPIEGVFYAEEVQQVSKPELYQVEKVLKTKSLSNGQTQRLVKWVGYKQPTWTTSNIISNTS